MTTHHSIQKLKEIHARGPIKASNHHPMDGFNRWLAVTITTAVGSMWCAYVFAIISLLGNPLWAPAWLQEAVQWVSQNFIQLVLLSVIMVGQSVVSLAADAQRERDHEILGHEAEILDSLHTMQVQQTEILHMLDPREKEGRNEPERSVHIGDDSNNPQPASLKVRQPKRRADDGG